MATESEAAPAPRTPTTSCRWSPPSSPPDPLCVVHGRAVHRHGSSAHHRTERIGMDPNVTSMDRSKDTSWELASVRTVLSRARTAIDEIRAYQEWEKQHPDSYRSDPEAAEMLDALDRVIEELSRWEKAGARRKNKYRS